MTRVNVQYYARGEQFGLRVPPPLELLPPCRCRTGRRGVVLRNWVLFRRAVLPSFSEKMGENPRFDDWVGDHYHRYRDIGDRLPRLMGLGHFVIERSSRCGNEYEHLRICVAFGLSEPRTRDDLVTLEVWRSEP